MISFRGMKSFNEISLGGTFLKISIFVVVILAMVLLNMRAEKEISDYEFNGKIDYVIYEKGNCPVITVSKKDFHLGSHWSLGRSLNIGDSIIKKKGEMIIRVIKHSNGEEQIFK